MPKSENFIKLQWYCNSVPFLRKHKCRFFHLGLIWKQYFSRGGFSWKIILPHLCIKILVVRVFQKVPKKQWIFTKFKLIPFLDYRFDFLHKIPNRKIYTCGKKLPLKVFQFGSYISIPLFRKIQKMLLMLSHLDFQTHFSPSLQARFVACRCQMKALL